MKKINWKVRFSNPLFIGQMILAIFVPILAYMGINIQDLTTWGRLGHVLFEAVSNPYVLVLVLLSVYNAITDPTVKGFKDSKQALNYLRPKNDEEYTG